MKRILLATAALLALAAVPAQAASQLAIGTGFNFGQVTTGAATTTHGLAAAGSLATGQNQSIGTGFAVNGPAGSVSAGVGASAGQSNSISAAGAALGGSAATAGQSTNTGIGVGLGFTNVTP